MSLPYEIRQELCRNIVIAWAEARAFKQTHAQALDRLTELVWNQDRFKKLPWYEQWFVRGYAESYRANVVETWLEYGNTVTMPDGSEKWFGLKSRLRSSVVYDAGIDYRYRHEHSIKDRTGIFWDTPENPGTHLFF